MFSSIKDRIRRPFRRLEEQIVALEQQIRTKLATIEDAQRVQAERAFSIDAKLAALLARTSASAAETKERGLFNRERLNALGVLNYENPVVSGERRFLRSYFENYPDALVFDVGANAGHYAELVRELAPKADIHCFEPSPDSFASLAERHLSAVLRNCGAFPFKVHSNRGTEHAAAGGEVVARFGSIGD